MSTGLVDTAVRLHKGRGGKITRGHSCLLRSVNGDFTSSRGYRWPFPGNEAVAAGVVKSHKGPCPSAPGDGLCLGKTWRGIASGGIPASTLLLCSYSSSAVLGEDAEKVRVSRAAVLDVFTFASLVAGATDDERADLYGANLYGADLYGADLRGADLRGANLRGANLSGADLSGADLYGADLSGADLSGADLSGADLCGANLRGANLRWANLRWANLRWANLSGADLYRADLRGADLYRADLRGANLPATLTPADAKERGAIL